MSPHTHITEKSSGRPAAPYTTCDLEGWKSYVVTKRVGVVGKRGNYAAPGADWLTCESHLIRRRNLRRKSYNDRLRKEKNRGLLPEYHDFKPLALNTFYPYEKNGAVVREREPWLGEVVPRAITHTIVESGSTSAKGSIPDKQRERLPKTTDDLKPTEYKAAYGKIRKTSKERPVRISTYPAQREERPEDWNLPEGKYIPHPELQRWEAYWKAWDEQVGAWWSRLADENEDPRKIAQDLLAHAIRHQGSTALYSDAAARYKEALKAEGPEPDSKGWERIVKTVLVFIERGLPALFLIQDGGRGLRSIVYANRKVSTKHYPSLRTVASDRHATKISLIAANLQEATRRAIEEYESDNPDEFLWLAHNKAASYTRRGGSPKQAELENYTWSLDRFPNEESGPMSDYVEDPDGEDPAEEFAEAQRRAAVWEAYVLAHQVAKEKLKGTPLAVFNALYVERDGRSVGEIAADLEISTDNFYQAKRRALSRIKKALIEEGIEGVLDPADLVAGWWLEGPWVPEPATGRSIRAFERG